MFFAILLTERCPRGLFNRWTYRVISYGALMRDPYPRVRLEP